VITVGAALSLTGRFAVQGEQAHRGLQLWVEDVNAAGGMVVPERGGSAPIRLLIHDDQSRVGPAAALAEQLVVNERVDLLIGPYSSALTLAVAPVAERHHKVLWNHGGSSDAIDEQGFRYLVNLLSPAGRYFVGLLDMVSAEAPSARRVALLHGARGTFARAVAAGAETYAVRLGFELILAEPYPPTKDGFGDLVPRVAAHHPDLILGVGTTEADLRFARALRDRRVGVHAIGLVAAPIRHFKDVLGADADGFCGPSQWEPSVSHVPDLGPTSDQFATRFRARFRAEPDYPAAQAYAAGLIAARCVEVAGTLRDDPLRQAADALDLHTFYGGFRLDRSTGQQIGHDLVVVQWQDGIKRMVWPPAIAEACPRFSVASP
jgi:branched-chain amino acid transport system substrate-binding protein